MGIDGAMDDGRRAMDDGRWAMGDGPLEEQNVSEH